MAPRLQAEAPEVASAARGPSRALALRGFAPVGVILVLALALRLWGITWALPNQERYYTYHPDEGVNLIQGVMVDGVPRPHLDLRFYNYGGLYFYLWQGAVVTNRAYSLVSLPPLGDPYSPSSESVAAMILVGRLLTVLLGTLTAWVVFALGNRLFGRRVGLLAAFIWAIMPAAVVHGHYATVDVPATFFVTVALVFAGKLMGGGGQAASGERQLASGRKEWLRPLLLAGLFSGLAAATKYNCVLVLAAPVAAVVVRSRSRGRLPRWAGVAMIAMAVVGFAVGCPGALINPAGFWHDFSYELHKSQQGMDLLFANTGNGWWFHLASSLRFGLGVPLLLLTLSGLGLALVRRTQHDLMLLAFLVVYYLVIGFAQVRFLRYVIPIFPVLAVFAARLVLEPWSRVAVRRAVQGLSAVALATTLLVVLALDRVFVQPDTRDQAKEYIDAALPHGATLAFVWTPWFQSPPLTPGFTLPSTVSRREAALTYADKRLLIPVPRADWDLSVLGPPLPDAFAVSEFETGDVKRLGMAKGKPFFDLWRTRYTAHVFDKTPSIFGIDFGKPTYTPTDWLYPNPRTTVYVLHP